jgi:hypothetical protein
MDPATNPGQIAAVPELAVIVQDVVGRRHGRRDAEEVLVRVLPCDLLGERLVAEGGGEDQIVALSEEIALDVADVRRFRYGLYIRGFDARLLLEAFPALIVAIGPAGVPDRPDVNERGAQVLLGIARAGRCGQRQSAARAGDEQPGPVLVHAILPYGNRRPCYPMFFTPVT